MKKRAPYPYHIYFLLLLLVVVIIYGNSYWNNKYVAKTSKFVQAQSNTKISKRQNKKWDAVSDNITSAKNYQGKVQALTQLAYVNSYGVDGSCITAVNNLDTNAMCNIVDNLDHSADIISIFGGTNDYGTSKLLGTKNNTSSTTFYGALRTMVNKLKAQNPKAKIVIFTPLQRNWQGVNLSRNRLVDYVNAIKYIGKADNIPVLDLYNTSGITSKNIDQYTKDGVCPNEAGFKMISKVMADFINKQ